MPTRRGLTLIELIVVLAVLGVICGLVIPGILRAREASRRTQCRNNVKQIGLALHNYHDTFNTFPPGYIADTAAATADPATLDDQSGFGWTASSLPYYDASPLYNQLNFSLPCWSPSNSRLLGRQPPTFVCMSAPGGNEPIAINVGAPGTSAAAPASIVFGRSHYVANAGTVAPWRLSPPLPDWTGVADGVMYRNSSIRISDIKDGSSNTILVAESSVGADHTWPGVVAGARNCLSSPSAATPAPCDAAATFVLFSAGTPADGGVRPPGARPTAVDQPSSGHAGGTHVLFTDGVVHFIKYTIDPALWAKLCTRAGHEQNHAIDDP